MKLGIIKERKVPQDTRVPLTPLQVKSLEEKFDNLEIHIRKSDTRCIKDEEYEKMGLKVVDDVSDCDVLLGVKEVPINWLFSNKTYLFFSHTIKEQPYNKKLLQAILNKKIRMIDYETLTDEQGVRLIGFGRFAGIVGAHYAMLMWGEKTGLFKVKKAVECHDYAEMLKQYKGKDLGKPKIFITGNGRVSKGSAEVLDALGIKKVKLEDYLTKEFEEAVYVQCDMDELYEPQNGDAFDFHHFFNNPEKYKCLFNEYMNHTDILINGMYWNPHAERLFEKEDVKKEDFKIKIISDISCDIEGSVPINYRATTISDPIYGVDKSDLKECKPYQQNSIEVMTVDNLPNELPKDASQMFGEVLSEKIVPLLVNDTNHPILEKATIAENGKLTKHFSYLENYVKD